MILFDQNELSGLTSVPLNPSVSAIGDIGVVINYYWQLSYPKSNQISTWVSLLKLKEINAVNNIILVDGSPTPDEFMESICNELSINYHSTGRRLSYAEGFNIGIERLNNQFICLMANDILTTRDDFEILYEWVKKPDVGCAFPYLSFSDYPGQMPFFVRKPVTCEPTCMTLNINLFPRNVLEEIGGVDEGYSGSYNDVIMLTKIRNSGYRVVLVGNTNVVHIGKTTITQGSDYKKDDDFLRFSEEYPQFRAKHGKWQIKHWVKPFAINRKIAVFWWVSQNFPSTRLRKFMEWLTIWLEPELTRINREL